MGDGNKDSKRKRPWFTKKRVAQSILLFACFVLLIYLILSLMYFFFQDDYLYQSDPDVEHYPTEAGLDYEELYLTTKDGETLNAWYVPCDNATLTVLYCHGNSKNMGRYVEHVRILHNCGLNVLTFDYRGYGKSSGETDEHGTYRDVLCAWQYLTDQRGVAPSTVVVYGRSMGGPIAAWMARTETPGALVLDSTFTTYVEEARHITLVLPVGSLSTMDYPTIEYVKEVHCPVLVVHSRDDLKIPYRNGKRLYDAAAGPKEFLTISGGHGSCVEDSEEVYSEGLKDFLANNL